MGGRDGRQGRVREASAKGRERGGERKRELGRRGKGKVERESARRRERGKEVRGDRKSVV